MTPRTLIVDGTRDVIADGRSCTMHAICNKTDYTANRIIGYAHSLEDAHVFAAAFDMRDALQEITRESDKLSEPEFRLAVASLTKSKGE